MLPTMLMAGPSGGINVEEIFSSSGNGVSIPLTNVATPNKGIPGERCLVITGVQCSASGYGTPPFTPRVNVDGVEIGAAVSNNATYSSDGQMTWIGIYDLGTKTDVDLELTVTLADRGTQFVVYLVHGLSSLTPAATGAQDGASFTFGGQDTDGVSFVCCGQDPWNPGVGTINETDPELTFASGTSRQASGVLFPVTAASVLFTTTSTSGKAWSGLNLK